MDLEADLDGPDRGADANAKEDPGAPRWKKVLLAERKEEARGKMVKIVLPVDAKGPTSCSWHY